MLYNDIGVERCPTNCSVLRTYAILPAIRISWGPCPTLCSCLGGFQSQMSPFVQARGATDFFTLAWSNIKIMMPYELLRAVHLRNSASHSHTMGPLPHFMLMSGRVPKSDVPIRASTRGHTLFHPGIIIIKKI